VLPDMHGIYRARTPEAIISDTHYIPSILWVCMTVYLAIMLLTFKKNKLEKSGRKETILKQLSWKKTLTIIMMLTMNARAMTEIETGDLPVLRDTTGIVICRQELNGRIKQPLDGRN
jgi:hypothetical protein